MFSALEDWGRAPDTVFRVMYGQQQRAAAEHPTGAHDKGKTSICNDLLT